MIDGHKCDNKRLGNYELVFKLLDSMPKQLKMTKVTMPYVIKWKDKGSKVEGITGFVIIAESHISIHTFPQTSYITADIYSCKEFNTKKATELIVKAFKIKEVEINLVKRGKTIKPKRN